MQRPECWLKKALDVKHALVTLDAAEAAAPAGPAHHVPSFQPPLLRIPSIEVHLTHDTAWNRTGAGALPLYSPQQRFLMLLTHVEVLDICMLKCYTFAILRHGANNLSALLTSRPACFSDRAMRQRLHGAPFLLLCCSALQALDTLCCLAWQATALVPVFAVLDPELGGEGGRAGGLFNCAVGVTLRRMDAALSSRQLRRLRALVREAASVMAQAARARDDTKPQQPADLALAAPAAAGDGSAGCSGSRPGLGSTPTAEHSPRPAPGAGSIEAVPDRAARGAAQPDRGGVPSTVEASAPNPKSAPRASGIAALPAGATGTDGPGPDPEPAPRARGVAALAAGAMGTVGRMWDFITDEAAAEAGAAAAATAAADAPAPVARADMSVVIDISLEGALVPACAYSALQQYVS